MDLVLVKNDRYRHSFDEITSLIEERKHVARISVRTDWFLAKRPHTF